MCVVVVEGGGGGEGGQLRSRGELFVNGLFGPTVRVFFFIHGVLVTL